MDTRAARAAIYLRISVEKADAIARQRAACKALCEARGWVVVTEYVDDGVSASRSRDSAAFGRLLADARAGEFEVVVAWAADRLVRRLSDLERLIDTGVKAATVQGGLDLTTPEGEAQASILGTFARMEGRQKAERQRAANAQRAARGEPPIGRRLIGWRPGEGDAVRDAVDLVLHGGSLGSVMRTWNAAGLRTSSGGPWRRDSVRDVLLNPRIAGLRVYQGQTIQGKWEPLITEDTWRAVVEVLTSPERKTGDGTRRKWLLSGYATCGVPGCGVTVTTGGRAHRGTRGAAGAARTLRCSASNHMVRAAEPVEEFVTAAVVERLSRPDAVTLLEDQARDDRATLRTRAQTLRTRLDGLAELVADGTLGPAGARGAAGRLRAELTEVEAQLADAGRVSILGPLVGAADVQAVWDTYDIDRQRAVAETLMSVVVHPTGRGARTFRPETVGITWLA